MKDNTALNAIQPMRYGWLIYICTIADHEKLVSLGIILAGRYIPLRSELCSNCKTTVKVTLKDLPLHAVSNSEVLEALCEVIEVESEVSYCNVWYEGRLTNIQNGDRLVYIEATEISKLADFLQVGEYCARVFKLKNFTVCKHCSQEGHYASDKSCPARAPHKVEDTIDAFRGGKYPLSNLHKCPYGCVAKEGEKIFPSSEH